MVPRGAGAWIPTQSQGLIDKREAVPDYGRVTEMHPLADATRVHSGVVRAVDRGPASPHPTEAAGPSSVIPDQFPYGLSRAARANGRLTSP
jgi:hypothetical protein